MSETMAAIIKTAPKPGCMEYVTDFPKPEIKEDEILVQVKAVSYTHLDVYKRQKAFFPVSVFNASIASLP